MPLDWQTAVVTAIALAAAFVIVRRFVPAKRRRAPGGAAAVSPAACDHCETGAKATASAVRDVAGRTATTPVVSVDDLRTTARSRARH